MEVIASRAGDDLNLASRKAQEAALRRFQATEWLESIAGPLVIPKQPSEKQFISCLRNGLILCHAINEIEPGSVPKVVEISRFPSQSLTWDSQPLTAYQFFENVRNFLKAVEGLKLPVFEASVFERDNMVAGSSSKIVDCVLGLKEYNDRKQRKKGNECIYEGNEVLLFYAIFQSFMVLKGGLSDGYKNHISEKRLPDDTYKEDGIALFRVQGSGPENMQSIQVDSVASSLNSSYCYILHKDSFIFTWKGSQTSVEVLEDHELAERQLDVIKPDMQTRVHKERAESDEFWEILGGKTEHATQKIYKEAESDPHLFSCILTKGEDLRVSEIYNFNQGDLMTEDIYILDCHK